MSGVIAGENAVVPLAGLRHHLEEADRVGRRDFKLVAVGDARSTLWILAEVSPGQSAPWWHVSVIENGTGIVNYTKRAVRTDGVGFYLRLVQGDGVVFRERPATESAENPYHPDPKAKERRRAKRSVYFVQPIHGGLVKIGVAADVAGRLNSMQTGSPVQLRVIGVIPDVGQDRETELHQRFAESRSHGEWFEPTPELLAYIDENAVAA